MRRIRPVLLTRITTIIVLYLVPVSYSLYWSAGGRFAVEDEYSSSANPAERAESIPVMA